MSKFFQINLITAIAIGFLLSSCSNKNKNFDLDLSNLKRVNKFNRNIRNTEIPASAKTKSNIVKNELINYQNKSDVLNSIKFGKIDPFSEEKVATNNLISSFKLTGILSTKINNYAFVNYLGREGTITADSIGGENTFLLPNGAKVININPKSLKLIINFENKNYIFKL